MGTWKQRIWDKLCSCFPVCDILSGSSEDIVTLDWQAIQSNQTIQEMCVIGITILVGL